MWNEIWVCEIRDVVFFWDMHDKDDVHYGAPLRLVDQMNGRTAKPEALVVYLWCI